jgi:flagellin
MKFQIGASSTETMTVDLSRPTMTRCRQHPLAGAGFKADASAGAERRHRTDGRPPTPPSPASTPRSTSVSKVRSKMGAAANRLDHVYNNLANISTNSKAATGRIMDVDFATESSNMTSNQMLMQAGTAMLKQTNQMSSMVMSLLQ